MQGDVVLLKCFYGTKGVDGVTVVSAINIRVATIHSIYVRMPVKLISLVMESVLFTLGAMYVRMKRK